VWFVVYANGALVKQAVASSTGGTSTTPSKTTTNPGYAWG